MIPAFPNQSNSQNMVVGLTQASSFVQNMFGMGFSSCHFCRTSTSKTLYSECLTRAYRKTGSLKHSKTIMIVSGDMDSQSGHITVTSAAMCCSLQMAPNMGAQIY